MTENKRFALGMEDGIPQLVDNETNCWYPIKDTRGNVKTLVNRLNDLETFREGYNGLVKQYSQLCDENHRLRLTMVHLKELDFDIEWLKEHLTEWDKK